MRKLLSANVARLVRSKTFWCCLLLCLVAGAWKAADFCREHSECNRYLYPGADNVYQEFGFSLPFVIAVFISIWLGSECSTGVIRNKIIAGYTKGNVYLANWLTCVIASVVLNLVQVITSAIPTSPWIIIFKEFEHYGKAFAYLMRYLGVSTLVVAALASVFVMIHMLLQKRTLGLVVSLAVLAVLMFTAAEMYGAINAQMYIYDTMDFVNGEFVPSLTKVYNPDYISGIKKDIYSLILDIQPIGQLFKFGRNTNIILYMCYSGIITVLTMGGGMLLFRKKNLQ